MGNEPIEIPLVDLAAQRRRLGADIEVAMAAVLEHGQFILGPEVAQLEEALARRCGVAHAVGCSSGTDALLLALLAWGVGPGQAVFVPTFSFVATAEVVAFLGATPVFVDIEAATFNLDPTGLAAAVGSARNLGLRPAGVIAVDLFGQPADYTAIRAVAADEGMWVLADAAQSLGATSDGRSVGSLADATATSFFPAKPLGCYGDGGAVFTDDARLADQLRSLRVHGKGEDKYDNVRIGTNSRLDTLQAAVLLAKLPFFDDELDRRQRVADRYAEGLAGVVGTPTVVPGATSAWANYTVTAPRPRPAGGGATAGRDRHRRLLRPAAPPAEGVPPVPGGPGRPARGRADGDGGPQPAHAPVPRPRRPGPCRRRGANGVGPHRQSGR